MTDLMMFPDGGSGSSQDEGVHRVRYEKDPGISNCYTFTIMKEDHTLGNLLTQEMLNEERVLFAGYRIVHPLSDLIMMRVNVKNNVDKAEELVEETVRRLKSNFTVLANDFKRQLEEWPRQQYRDVGRREY